MITGQADFPGDGGEAAALDPRGLFRRIPLAPHLLTADVTPAEDCFVLAHLGVARVDPERWRPLQP